MTAEQNVVADGLAVIDGLARIGTGPAWESASVRMSGLEAIRAVYGMVQALSERGVGPESTVAWNAGDVPAAVFVRLAGHLLGVDDFATTDDGAVVLSADDRIVAEFARMSEHDKGGSPADYGRVASRSGGLVGSAYAAVRKLFAGDPGRTVTFSSFLSVGGDAAYASWIAGATVIAGPPRITPARALAFLESSDATHAVLPADLAISLAALPALRMTDLSALRGIMCHDGPLGDKTTTLETALAVTVVEVPAIAALGKPTYSPMDDQLVAREVALAADNELASVDVAGAVAAIDQLGYTALLSMLNALRERGLFDSPGDGHTQEEILIGAGVAPEHRGLIRRWLVVLVQQKLLQSDGTRFSPAVPEESFSDLESGWEEVESAWRKALGTSGTIDYARKNAERLPDLITGACRAVELLFPEGRTDLADALYRESITARYQQRAVSVFVGALARRWTSERPLRILEIGAGTGSTTDWILPVLADSGTAVEYLYTDVSKYFLDQARIRLRDYPWVTFDRYDIDVEPRAQGFATQTFDLVVGGGVLNAARHTDSSVRWLTALLQPGGWLVVTEPTVEEFWVLASQAFMMADARDGRNETGATFLSLNQWNAVIDDAGLDRVVGLPGPGHPLERLGHRVFAARRPQ